MKTTTTKAQATRRVGDTTNFETSIHWIMAALLFGGAIACVIYFKPPFNLDPGSRDFNPLVFVPIALALFGLRPLAKAIRHTLLARRFGESTLEMAGESVPLGGTLDGTIRTSRRLVPGGDYKIWLRCIEAIRIEAIAEPTRYRIEDHVRWEALREVPRDVDSQRGIAFEFAIPEKALATADPRAKGAVRWTLEIGAPLRGIDYYALFPLIVRGRQP